MNCDNTVQASRNAVTGLDVTAPRSELSRTRLRISRHFDSRVQPPDAIDTPGGLKVCREHETSYDSGLPRWKIKPG